MLLNNGSKSFYIEDNQLIVNAIIPVKYNLDEIEYVTVGYQKLSRLSYVYFQIVKTTGKKSRFYRFDQNVNTTATFSSVEGYLLEKIDFITQKRKKGNIDVKIENNLAPHRKLQKMLVIICLLFIGLNFINIETIQNILKVNNMREIINKSSVFYVDEKRVKNTDELKRFLLDNISVKNTILHPNKIHKLDKFHTLHIIENQNGDKIEIENYECSITIKLDSENKVTTMFLDDVNRQQYSKEICDLISKK